MKYNRFFYGVIAVFVLLFLFFYFFFFGTARAQSRVTETSTVSAGVLWGDGQPTTYDGGKVTYVYYSEGLDGRVGYTSRTGELGGRIEAGLGGETYSGKAGGDCSTIRGECGGGGTPEVYITYRYGGGRDTGTETGGDGQYTCYGCTDDGSGRAYSSPSAGTVRYRGGAEQEGETGGYYLLAHGQGVEGYQGIA